MAKQFIIYSDGGARGNPGPAAYGAVILNESGVQIVTLKKYLGEKTNNQAEYEGLIAALQKALELGAREVACFLDSELVVRQLRGEYKIKNQGIAPLAGKVLALSNQFDKVFFSHIAREKNQVADDLVNQAIDEVLSH